VKSLVYSALVDGLTPYTEYEFLLSVDNSAGSLQLPVSAVATTLPAGTTITVYCLINAPHNASCAFFRLSVRNGLVTRKQKGAKTKLI